MSRASRDKKRRASHGLQKRPCVECAYSAVCTPVMYSSVQSWCCEICGRAWLLFHGEGYDRIELTGGRREACKIIRERNKTRAAMPFFVCANDSCVAQFRKLYNGLEEKTWRDPKSAIEQKMIEKKNSLGWGMTSYTCDAEKALSRAIDGRQDD